MRNGQYIRIDELVLLVAFVLFIPAILSTLIQLLLFAKLQAWRMAPRSAGLGIIFTLTGGVTLTILLMVLLPQRMVQFVGIQEVPFLGRRVTVLPLAFLAFGVSAVLSTLWVTRRVRGAA